MKYNTHRMKSMGIVFLNDNKILYLDKRIENEYTER